MTKAYRIMAGVLLALLGCSVAPSADQPKAHVLGRITLRPLFAYTLKTSKEVKTAAFGSLGNVLGLEESIHVAPGDRLIFLTPSIEIERTSSGSELKTWIGMKKETFVDGFAAGKFKQAVRESVCGKTYPLRTVNRVEYADPQKPPLTLAGEVTGTLADSQDIPTSGRPREVDVSLLMVPRTDDLKSADYSALIFTVSCQDDKP